jgi:alkylation response protein AidB-like acyl-CoA dehydrogenase
VDFEFDADQELLRDSVRRYLADRAPIPWVRAMLDDPRGTTDAVWRGLADLGVLALLVPEADGGAGMGMVDAAVVLEELGRAVHPGPFVASAVAAASLLSLAGTEAARRAWLPGIADGSVVATVAVDEPGRRSEWRSPTTEATAAGDTWAVTGTKVHVPYAATADVVLVTATLPDGALGVVVVEAGTPRVTITPTDTVDGTRREATVVLDGAPARPVSDGDASEAVGETVDRTGVAMVVDGVGAASRALEMAVDYAKERVQFDRPIGSFQAVQHLCADMLRAVELARAAAYYACWACDAADATERHRAATMALACATDGLYGVGASLVQVHGGIGFTWEHDAHLFYKRLLTLQLYGGGAGDHLEALAALILD